MTRAYNGTTLLTVGVFVLSASAFFAGANGAKAATRYVATNGATTDCTTMQNINTPASSIQSAVGCSGSGDFVEVRAGTYTGTGSTELVNLGGKNNLTLEAYNGEAVYLRNTYHVITVFTSTSGLTIRGLDINCLDASPINPSNTTNSIEGINFIAPNHTSLLIEKNNIHNCDDGMLGVGANITIRNNYIHDICAGCGGLFGHGMYVDLTDSFVYNNVVENMLGGSGMQLEGGNNTKIYNNTFVNGVGHGPIVYHDGTAASNFQFFNNIFANYTGAGISFYNTGVGHVVQHNLFYNNGSDFDCSSGCYPNTTYTQSNNILGAANRNPLFVNPSAHDYHLQAGSPAIDAGVNVGLPYIGSAPDIGACEYGGTCNTSGGGGISPPPPPPSGCQNLWDSTKAVTANFGASFNLFSSLRELIMSVACTSNSATLNVGNGTVYEYIYKTGYIWTNSQWTPFNYSGNMDTTGNWIIGKASASTNIVPGTSVKQSVLAYICEWTGVWKCGCNDSACATSYWNLQQFK